MMVTHYKSLCHCVSSLLQSMFLIVVLILLLSSTPGLGGVPRCLNTPEYGQIVGGSPNFKCPLCQQQSSITKQKVNNTEKFSFLIPPL